MNLNIAIKRYCHHISFFFIHCCVSDRMLYLCVCLQCHEACIAIYSSMENQKLSHWVCISTLSMFFCLLVYTLTGASLFEDQRAEHHGVCLEPTTMSPPFPPCRCVWLHDLWTGGCRRYSDVLSRERCGHDHFPTAFWNIDHYHLPNHSAPGKVSAAWDKVSPTTSVSHCRNVLSRCPSPEQVRHPELGSASWETSARNSHSFLREPLQSRSHRDLDQCHCPHCHVCPRHE